ncbi:hypothetical protein [Actinomadura harenae]|uniref:Uncharacterized protein n=1 Tax=Actinomadura harenae TaxID=2483351 RepID=A0A3M2M3T2_9ACTN|nr:hypothetical protein [Actinomadura harenae]RMI44226.1 hypothetical protein EBO15_13840 [Actinomadura harenae]
MARRTWNESIPGIGTFFVGIDIQPGRYRCDDGKGGWWVRFAGTGGGDPVGSWPLPDGPTEVEIPATDFAFETHVRTYWRRVADVGSEPSPDASEPRPVTDPTLRAELDPLVRRRRPLVALAPFSVLGMGFAGLPVLGSMWLLGMTMLAALVAIGAPTVFLDLTRAHELDKRRDRFVVPEDLDDEARALLARTQTAVDAVRASEVNREGLLESAENAVILPREEWEIAHALARQSRLRADEPERDGDVPEVEAVLRPLREKLNRSVTAVTRRVEALERYADHVRAADEVLVAQRRVDDLTGRAHEYDELLAETVRDDMALPEIERMTERSDDLLTLLRARLKDSAPDA